jgi:hypothetical protein
MFLRKSGVNVQLTRCKYPEVHKLKNRSVKTWELREVLSRVCGSALGNQAIVDLQPDTTYVFSSLFLCFYIFCPHAFAFHSSKLNIEPPPFYLIHNDIHLLQLGFHPAAVVGKLIQKQERHNYLQQEKQYTKQYKKAECTKKQNTKQIKKNIKRMIKDISRVIKN